MGARLRQAAYLWPTIKLYRNVLKLRKSLIYKVFIKFDTAFDYANLYLEFKFLSSLLREINMKKSKNKQVPSCKKQPSQSSTSRLAISVVVAVAKRWAWDKLKQVWEHFQEGPEQLLDN